MNAVPRSHISQDQACADELAKELLERMCRIRMVEEAIADRYPEQRMRCPVHLSTGQEAVAVGVCASLRSSDQVMSTHRSHAHYLAKGGDLKAMIAELHGKETGCCHGRGGSMHLLDTEVGFMGAVPIVASTIPIAVGLAFANQLQNRDRAVVAFFGEGATEEGTFHESANFASLQKLPIIFACENNLYSVYSPMNVRQPVHRQVYEQAIGHGIKATQVDGNDVAAVHEASQKALQHVRSGRGPVFLEFLTYRWREHCGPNFDNHIGYRIEAEYLDWRKRDPIANFEQKLKHNGVLDEARYEQFKRGVRSEIEEAFAEAESAPFPSAACLLDHVYS